MLTVDDVKLTVLDYSIGKVTEQQAVILQRYFLREYFKWMPLRAIAEATGGRDHTRVLDAIRCVKKNQKLFSLSHQLKFILDSKLHGRDLNYEGVRLWWPKLKKKNGNKKIKNVCI